MILLTAGAAATINFPDFRDSLQTPGRHTPKTTGRDMDTIQNDIIAGMEATVRRFNTRRLTFSGRVTVANTYPLSRAKVAGT